jgi:hypothetical protein
MTKRPNIHFFISRARRAQQQYEQLHDVQLEIEDGPTLFDIEQEEMWREHWQDRVANDFIARRQAQIEDETGRDPRD